MNKNGNPKKRSAAAELISGMIILSIAVILLTILFPKLFMRNFDGLEPVVAIVTEINHHDGDISETILTYTYGEKEYNGSTTQISGTFVGQKLNIYVDPEAPTSIRFANDMSRLFGILRLLSIINIVIMILLWIQYKIKHRVQ